MKINKRSWHYKVWAMEKRSFQTTDIYLEDHPPNLCRYFWTVAGKLLWYGGWLLAALICVGMFIYKGFVLDIWGWYVLAGVAAFAAVLRAAFVIHNKLADLPPRPPGLIRQYLAARKAKLCPRIEFINADTEEARP